MDPVSRVVFEDEILGSGSSANTIAVSPAIPCEGNKITISGTVTAMTASCTAMMVLDASYDGSMWQQVGTTMFTAIGNFETSFQNISYAFVRARVVWNTGTGKVIFGGAFAFSDYH